MQYHTRKWIKPLDLNGHSRLFGGTMLAWVDEESAIFATTLLNSTNIVTAHMSAINFKSSAKQNEIIEIGCDIVKIGKTSITVKCTVRNMMTQQEIITVDEIVFVHLDANGKPSPHKLYVENLEKEKKEMS